MNEQERKLPRDATIPQPIRNDGAGWIDNGPRDVMRDRD